MMIVLFHMFYLFGQYMCKNRIKKLRILCDAAKETKELSFEQQTYEMLDDNSSDDDNVEELTTKKIKTLTFKPPAYMQRYNAVVEILDNPTYLRKIRKIVDFGCSEMGFLRYLKNVEGVEEILCVDIDRQVLERYKTKAEPYLMEHLSPRKIPLVIELCEGSVTHNDRKLDQTDAVICIELIEHLYPDTLMDLSFNIFEYIIPKVAIVTTPNADFNVLFPNFSGYRHPDHKFEWTRKQFQDWAQNIVMRYPSYYVTFHDICKGPVGTEELGSCSQMAVFHRHPSLIEECNKIIGVEGLFKTVARYDYPIYTDDRSYEEQLLHEAQYQIIHLSFQKNEAEIILSDILPYLKENNFNITVETLKKVLLANTNWKIEDGKDGPIVKFSSCPLDDEDEDEDENENENENENEENISEYDDYEYESSVNKISANLQDLSEQNSYIKNWNEQLSIIIPENHSIVQENTYLFDGENFLSEDQSSEESHVTGNNDIIKHSKINNISEFLICTEQELPTNSTSLSLNKTKMNDRTETEINADIPLVLDTSSTISNSSLILKNSSADNTIIKSTLSQDSDINLTITELPKITTLNFQPYMSVSHSPTSSESLFFNSSNYSKINNSCNFEQMTSVKNQICENNDMIDMIPISVSSSVNNEPRFTSSPKASKISANNIELKELTPAVNRSILPSIKDTINIVSDINSSLSKDSQKSCNSTTELQNSTAETIKLCTSSLSDDINMINTSKNNIDLCLISNNAQQHLCLENKEFTEVVKSTQSIDEKFIERKERNVLINHKSDFADVQNAHSLPSNNENINNKEENVCCILTKVNDNSTKAHQENVITQSNVRKKSLKNLPKELSNFKSQNNNECSTECAKKTNVLENDKLVSSSSNKDTNNVHQSIVLKKDDEIVGTSKDVNISNIVGLANNIEVKSVSPFETPPNSWSPEIMDSGYPNSASVQDITPEYDLSSIAQDHIPDSESPSIAEAPRLGILEPIEVENGDLANNNRDDEGNNMMAVDINNIENLQPFIDVLENDLENENDIYVMQNGFPIWLLRLLDMENPLDFDMQDRQNLRDPEDEVADANYVGRDEGFDSSSSESDI